MQVAVRCRILAHDEPSWPRPSKQLRCFRIKPVHLNAERDRGSVPCASTRTLILTTAVHHASWPPNTATKFGPENGHAKQRTVHYVTTSMLTLNWERYRAAWRRTFAHATTHGVPNVSRCAVNADTAIHMLSSKVMRHASATKPS